jgi:predicted DCC family thiol-disulfide oxidoreductase YuxK
VRWSLRRDTKRKLLFASLDGEHGIRLRRAFPQTASVDSIVLRDGDRVYLRSDAILRIARELSGPWRLATALRVVPRPLRDAAYDFIARRRYRWYGRLDACPMPPASERDRFIDA